MICRARPKYLKVDDFDSPDVTWPAHFDATLFFNSGRAGLKFFLDHFRSFHGKDRLRVALSSFNCDSLMKGILQADATAILLDVKRSDMSISLASLKAQLPTPDVLILVHYQGIPNMEYLDIAEYCRAHQIALIEDLSHVHGSTFKGQALGSQGMVSLHSHAFDKPFTALYGGAISVGTIKADFESSLRAAYLKLPEAPKLGAKRDLAILRSLFFLTAPQSFRTGIDRVGAISFFLSMGFSTDAMSSLYKSSGFVSMLWRLVDKLKSRLKSDRIEVLRQHPSKLQLIFKQFQRWDSGQDEVMELEKWLSNQGIENAEFGEAVIEWNRYAVLDPEGVLSQQFSEMGVQAGNYNWPVTLRSKYARHPNVRVDQSLEESEYVARHVVNIPVWTDVLADHTA
ncbi:MAG: DegT/DnrJ/EryC1/StrS aminotransferase family protein [Flavobacteriales bacterium]|nr:DegT/DnrJ/EryC1/StrS aminotransferase family protein [Flavobacteriales bacterium]